MKILALEFSSRYRSAAFLDATPVLNSSGPQQEWEVSTEDTIDAFSLIESLLIKAGTERAEVNCIAIGIGPGSHAGIRSAIAIAQGWRAVMKVRLAAVESMEAVARRGWRQGLRGPIHLAVDAQRKEFYLSDYDLKEEAPVLCGPLRIVSSSHLQQIYEGGEPLMGPALKQWNAGAAEIYPAAIDVARIAWERGKWDEPETLQPIHLRETQFVKAPPARKDLLS